MKTDKKIRLTIGNNYQHNIASKLASRVPTGKNILKCFFSLRRSSFQIYIISYI